MRARRARMFRTASHVIDPYRPSSASVEFSGIEISFRASSLYSCACVFMIRPLGWHLVTHLLIQSPPFVAECFQLIFACARCVLGMQQGPRESVELITRTSGPLQPAQQCCLC